jgi:Tfp pilus assembly protein PilV
MQTRDSLRFGLSFINTLGAPTNKVRPNPDLSPLDHAAGVIEKAKGNPYRDEFGKFTDEANAVFNVNAKLPVVELEARNSSYEERATTRRKKAEKMGVTGLKPGFLHYEPKSAQTGEESSEWHKLNGAIGKAEAVANTHMERYRAAGEGVTEEGKALIQYWLANASAMRDMARILASKRDAAGASEEKSLWKQNDHPEFIQQAFSDVDAAEGEGEFSASEARRAKAYIVNNAVQVGLMDREDANNILSGIGAEEVQEEPA